MKDWYHPDQSDYYRKSVRVLTVNSGGFVIEASQYGDALALADAAFSQGIPSNDTCGQSIVFGVHEVYGNQRSLKEGQKRSLKEDKFQKGDQDGFSLGGFTVEQVWGYRRLIGSGGNEPHVGEVSLQNWNGPGNDYRDGYIFLSVKELDR